MYTALDIFPFARKDSFPCRSMRKLVAWLINYLSVDILSTFMLAWHSSLVVSYVRSRVFPRGADRSASLWLTKRGLDFR